MEDAMRSRDEEFGAAVEQFMRDLVDEGRSVEEAKEMAMQIIKEAVDRRAESRRASFKIVGKKDRAD